MFLFQDTQYSSTPTLLIHTLVWLSLPSVLWADEHAQDDMGKEQAYQYCGMNLDQFGHAAMTITYDEGTIVEFCSIHCAALDMQLHPEKTPEKIEVSDYNTGEKIKAEAAFWVLDFVKPGVMTTHAKWAFRDKTDAEAYIAKHRDTIFLFKEALEVALKW